ncbi:MAG: enoyl-CoA hydratase/isomerase family protein [Chitinophagales bacterium]
MSHFNINDRDGIRTVQMNRGSSNPINEAFVNELIAIFERSRDDDSIKGILLTGQPNFFSVGLDLPELYEHSPEDFSRFWQCFMTLIYTLATFDKPFVTSITGHAPAGGCVMAICADYRVMAEGKYKIGLNEIPVGIIVPPSIYELYALWLGRRAASQYLLEGKLHTVQEALNIGLIDAVADLEQVDDVAMQQLIKYTGFDQEAWRATKRNIRSNLTQYLIPKQDEHFEKAQKQWWKPEVRAALKSYIDQIKKKK